MRCGASLAHHGRLSSLNELTLWWNDLSSVPAQHLASLVSCVTWQLTIENVSGCDLVNLFTSLKCEELYIKRQSLGREETRALVQAMESGLEKVVLGCDVTLDIDALTEYSGQGVCRSVNLYHDTMSRYKEELCTWARSRNWRIVIGGEVWVALNKPQPFTFLKGCCCPCILPKIKKKRS